MRKFILSLAAFIFAAGITSQAFAYDDASFKAWHNKSMESEAAGQGTPVRVLKFVHYASADANATSLLSGDVVVYDTVSDDGVTVTRSITSGDGAIAGIVVTTIPSCDNTTATSAQSDRGRRNWGWIIVHGPATATISAGGTNAHAIGDPFIVSRDEGRITALENIIISTDSSVVYNSAHLRALWLRQVKAAGNSGGFFQDTSDGTSTTADVFVRIE